LVQPSDESFVERTEVLFNPDEIVRRTVEQCYTIKFTMDSCTDRYGPSMFPGSPPVMKACIDMNNRGVKIRFITEITKDNIQYCKELMKIAEVRHLDEVKGNFGIGDKRVYHGGADNIKSGPPPQLIISTVKSFVKQQQYFFDMLWKKAIPAEQKIVELEDGIEPEYIETIRDPFEIQKIGNDIIKSAKKEILIIFSSAKAFYRQDKAGTVDLLKQTADQNPNLKIRILTPISERLKEEDQIVDLDLGIRHIEPSMQTRVTVLIVDRRYSLTIELKDDNKDNSSEAIGLATYSNSKPTVLSFVSIFESLWMQTELYQQIKDANKRLKVHHRMQKEFINIAAHELRSPIQPILGLTEIIRRNEKDPKQKELLDVVERNAKRLKHLTEDILDVTKIESNSLHLNKQEFDLKDLVINTIQDYRNQMITTTTTAVDDNNNTNKIRSAYDYNDTKILVHADKHRINQVLSNLISNSIKFTKDAEGTISIRIKRDDNKNSDNKSVTVAVKDTGTGIDPQIMPRLFTKFATKSDTGTGLGLFISKSIVEAHGGRIWAENNSDGKGATFCFSLPSSR
jgi:two-component system, OmpR family, sensor histidine kinase VicK